MEITITIAVCFVVIMFGALISLGNERQRKALDSLRDQIVHWSIQDLKLKRDRIAREIKVDEPLEWFGKMISRATGRNPDIQFSGHFDDPGTLVFDATDFSGKFIVSIVGPADIRRMGRRAGGRLAGSNGYNPLYALPRGAHHYELSVLTCGAFFDLELQKAWKSLVGDDVGDVERIWVYEMS